MKELEMKRYSWILSSLLTYITGGLYFVHILKRVAAENNEIAERTKWRCDRINKKTKVKRIVSFKHLDRLLLFIVGVAMFFIIAYITTSMSLSPQSGSIKKYATPILVLML